MAARRVPITLPEPVATYAPPDLAAHLAPADALIVVPPFCSTDTTTLGAHVIQACARARGYEVRVLYANLLLARELGTEPFEQCVNAYKELLGERFFAPAAYGTSPAVYGGASGPQSPNVANMPAGLSLEMFAALAGGAEAWSERLAAAIAAARFPVVGCTTSFQQTAASVAILARVKAAAPDTITIMGGANCEVPMAHGLAKIADGVDFIFASDSEDTFPDFLDAVRHGELPAERVIRGELCADLDAIPTVDFGEYYDQLDAFSPDGAIPADKTWLAHEMSRGCSWGEKSPCTFCGQSVRGTRYRQKTADRVIAELRSHTQRYPSRRIVVSDNLMPREYSSALLARLPAEVPGLVVFHEVRANLSLEEVALCSEAHFIVQVGIEALSTPLLKLMRKGTTVRQNINFLRYARCVDLPAVWNLLCRFPGDRAQWYEDTLALLPLLVHLNPPAAVFPVRFDRFSVYHDSPERFGIRTVNVPRPYLDLLPQDAPHADIAYFFECELDSEFTGELEARLRDAANTWYELWKHPDGKPDEFEAWRSHWKDPGERPALEVSERSDGSFELTDTRGLPGCASSQTIDADRATVALAGRVNGISEDDVEWAIESKACALLDGRVVPLATASVELLRAFQSRARAHSHA
jgi:ribosomal peptide maturation radical SAM protein 1